MAAILGACSPVQENPGEAEELATEDKPLTGVTLGLGTGNFYTAGYQPLSNYAEQAFCEFSNLGAKWIRIEADSPGVDAETYRRIVQKAHAKGLSVLVEVPARYCGSDTNQQDIDAFTTSYVNHLSSLATSTFTGTTATGETGAADAYEIGNKPNVTEALCPDGVARFRVAPNAFAWLLRRTWDWKTANGRPELMVSGGVMNTFTTQPFWNSLVTSQAFVNGSAKIRPFDYFGIQPYNNPPGSGTDPVVDAGYLNCINSGLTTCFVPWRNNVTNGLKAAATRLNTATGTTDTKLFATEFGFQVISGPTCGPNVENCTLFLSAKTGSPPMDPPPFLQVAAAMAAAGDALVNSGVTPFGIWRDYRDDADGSKGFGLRANWDPNLTTGQKYVVKAAAWNKYRSMTGSTGNTNPEACWIKGAYVAVDFEGISTQRTTNAGDWAYSFNKGECAPGERIMGLSKSTANGWARQGLCYKDPLDANRYMHPPLRDPAPVPPPRLCTVRNVMNGSDRGQLLSPAKPPTFNQDWDSGNYLAECAPDEYVAGVAQSPDAHQFSHVLCCPSTVTPSSCSTVVFATADNRESTEFGDWDSAGYKGQCGVGRYVAGVSRTPAGQPHALLCCNQ
ncbi:hypothetical protein [Hyalangium sp.]|uniref:hypothetical protein n=1 Tax=Hyalangium sp. TaxID=2028555 RepID=UPI00389B1591